MDWREGYFRQAQSDYAMFRRLESMDDVAECHRLHYLQMATEKLAKGFMTLPGSGPFERTHNAFLPFVRSAAALSAIRTRLKVKNFVSYKESLRKMEPLAAAIQSLSPEGEDHPNPEYPWYDGTGTIQSPLDHSFANLRTQTNWQMQNLLRFIEACLAEALENG